MKLTTSDGNKVSAPSRDQKAPPSGTLSVACAFSYANSGTQSCNGPELPAADPQQWEYQGTMRLARRHPGKRAHSLVAKLKIFATRAGH